METYRWIWGILTFGTFAWCGLVTVYVAIKGVADIRNMLSSLGGGASSISAPPDNDSSS
jgi:hypothetical protein